VQDFRQSRERIPARLLVKILPTFLRARSLEKTVDETVASKQGQKLSLQLESMRIPIRKLVFRQFRKGERSQARRIYSDGFRKEQNRLIEYFLVHGKLGGRVEAVLMSGGPDPQSK
jgi:hypothetical protein